MILQVTDPKTNEFTGRWVTIQGLIKFRIVRSAGSKPSTLVAHVSTTALEENFKTNTRFWPFQGIRIIEDDVNPRPAELATDPNVVNLIDVMYFAGRIDSAYLKEDPERGRVWEISARCWLGLLADNNIGEGKWMTPKDTKRGKPVSLYGDKYKPFYEEYYGRPDVGWGEYRYNIIADLVSNIVPNFGERQASGYWIDNNIGIWGINYSKLVEPYKNDTSIESPFKGISIRFPNSLPIQIKFENSEETILQAIQRVAESDPWCDGLAGDTYIDIDATYFTLIDGAGIHTERTRYNNNITMDYVKNSRRGVGGDLQMAIRTVADGAGRLGEYVPRGWQFTGFYAYYGKKPTTRNNTKAHGIVEIDFGRDGLEKYTVTIGNEGSIDMDPTELNPSGAIVADKSSEKWDPINGLFRTKKTKVYKFDSMKDDMTKILGVEADSSKVRYNVDLAASNLINTLTASNGGINRGTITIVGRPKSLYTKLPIRPAEIIKLHIPHLGLEWSETVEATYTPNESSDFVVEQWSYDWPDERTVIEVTKAAPTNISTAVSKVLSTYAASHKDIYIAQSGWIPIYPLRLSKPSAEWPSGNGNHNIYRKPNGQWTTSNVSDQDARVTNENAGSYAITFSWDSPDSNVKRQDVVVEFGFYGGNKAPTEWDNNVKNDKIVPSSIRTVNDNKLRASTGLGSIDIVKKNNKTKIVGILPVEIQSLEGYFTEGIWNQMAESWKNLDPANNVAPAWPKDPKAVGFVTVNSPNLVVRFKIKKT